MPLEALRLDGGAPLNQPTIPHGTARGKRVADMPQLPPSGCPDAPDADCGFQGSKFGRGVFSSKQPPAHVVRPPLLYVVRLVGCGGRAPGPRGLFLHFARFLARGVRLGEPRRRCAKFLGIAL